MAWKRGWLLAETYAHKLDIPNRALDDDAGRSGGFMRIKSRGGVRGLETKRMNGGR